LLFLFEWQVKGKFVGKITFSRLLFDPMQQSMLICFRHVWLAALALLLAGLSVHAPAHAKTGTGSAGVETIMVFGDSLSAAYGISPREGWVALLEGNLKARNVNVVNASISGETTRGGLSRLKTDLAKHQPTIVVLALGANDGLRGLPVRETKLNIEKMIELIRQSGADVVLAGIQIPPNYGLEYARDFRDLYPALAKLYGLPLVPFLLDGIAENLDMFQADRLHPIAAAQPRIMQNVMPALNKAIESRSKKRKK
jgi:acyl-CoA thioesterase I